MKLCHPFHNSISEIKTKSSHLHPPRKIFRNSHASHRPGELTHPAGGRETEGALLAAGFFCTKPCPVPAQEPGRSSMDGASTVPPAVLLPHGDSRDSPVPSSSPLTALAAASTGWSHTQVIHFQHNSAPWSQTSEGKGRAEGHGTGTLCPGAG